MSSLSSHRFEHDKSKEAALLRSGLSKFPSGWAPQSQPEGVVVRKSGDRQKIKGFSKRAAVAIAAISLTACAELGMISSINASKREMVRSVAVASVLGNTFHGVNAATVMGIGEHPFTADVSNWRVDEALTQAAIAALQRTGRTAFALPASEDSDRRQLLEDARTRGADTLLIAVRSGYQNQPDYPPGYGFHQGLTFFGVDKSCIYSLFVVEAYDVASRRTIGMAWSFVPFKSGISCAGSDDIAWKGDFRKFTQEEKEVLRLAVLSSVSANVETSLKSLGLVQ